MNKYPTTFLECDKSYEESKIVLFGAPFDSTTSYRAGARLASRAIRTESVYAIESYSVYQDKDLSESHITDDGDLELPFGNAAKSLSIIESYVEQILGDNKLPVMIGGEHLVSLGAVRACRKKYEDLCVIHFDAHIDTAENILGESLSHGSVMRRIWELVGDNKIYQFGIRSGMRDEFEWASKHMTTNKFNLNNLDKAITEIGSKPVYITIDLDVLDPSIMSGTGTPEAGGMLFEQMRKAIMDMSLLNIAGYDMVELAPNLDPSGASTATACQLLREILLSVSK